MSMQLSPSMEQLVDTRNNSRFANTSTKKTLIIALIVAIILIVALVICTIILSIRLESAEDNEKEENVCSTEECQEISKFLKTNMNEDAKPCDDFYEFSCGGFIKNNMPDKSVPQIAQENILSQLKTLIPRGNSTNAINSAVQLLKKCLEQDPQDKDSVALILQLVQEILGISWPIPATGDWDFDWIGALARSIKNLRSGLLIGVDVVPGTDNSSYVTFLTVRNVQTFNTDILNAFICRILPNCTGTTYYSDFQDLSSFYSNKEKTNAEQPKVFDIYTIRELQERRKEVNWQKFFETLFEGSGININGNFTIMSDPGFISKMDKIINLDKRILAKILILDIITTWNVLLSSNIRQAVSPDLSLENLCDAFLLKNFGFLGVKLYMDKYISQNHQDELYNTIRILRGAFKKLLFEATWLSEQVRIAAIEKVDAMRSEIGGPLWIFEEDKLNAYYEEVIRAKEMNFVQASQIASRNVFNQQARLLNEGSSKHDFWLMILTFAVNAVYLPTSNSMCYPVGIIVKPFFSPGMIRAIKFGSFGFITGHETTHGFDSRGRNFDKDGAWRDWWDSETAEKFTQKTQCFIHEFSGIKDSQTGLPLNGTRTLNDDIADSGGIRAAYRAYKDAPIEKTNKLVGLEKYTEDQLFFISAAQFFCSNPSNLTLISAISTEVHSPDKYRVLVPYRNFPEFSKAFNCPVGSPMNSKNVCELW